VAFGFARLEAGALMLGFKTEVFEATAAHVVEAGGQVWTIKRGDRVAARHPALAANPSLFDPVGIGGPTQVEAEPVEQLPSKQVQMMSAKRTVSVEGCLLPGGFQMPGRTIIQAGEEVPATHPAYQGNKGLFEKV
jgi:hypothetical protein